MRLTDLLPARPRPARPADGLAWVTGASSGIGLAVAGRLLRDGWTVVVTARGAERLERFARLHAGRIVAAPADVTDADGLQRAVSQAQAQAGRQVALAVFAAGAWQPMSARDFDVARFRALLDANVMGVAAALACVMPEMIARQSGQIGIVASVAGYGGLPTMAGYGPTKAALLNLAESLKFDLDRHGVAISVICPGFVRTPMTAHLPAPPAAALTAEQAAGFIVDGLRVGRFEIAFPPLTAIAVKAAARLPHAARFGVAAALGAQPLAELGIARGGG